MTMHKGLIALTIPLLAAAAEPPRDWSATLRADAIAFHDAIAANHPGPVNRLDPRFTERNDAGLALALRRAANARDYPAYLWAMRAYVAGFDDGHVAFDVNQPVPLPLRWPGFLTTLDGAERAVVVTRADDVALPLGAELVSCDGIPAKTLAMRNVGDFRGRWSLFSQRASTAGRLFIDAGNPYVRRPARCRFTVDGRSREVVLQWRDLPDAEFDTRFAAASPRAHPEIGGTTLPDGTRWFTLSGFDSDPMGKDAKALVPLIASMKADTAGLAAAPRIVLDLRGNNGGSSDWSGQVATILWGAAAIGRLPSDSEAVDWRVSPGNLATIDGYRSAWRAAPDASPEAMRWGDRVSAGLKGALARGDTLWREADDGGAAPATDIGAPVLPPKGRVYVLTDLGCASACLDAVDLWTALGAVQIGQETGADSLYMDIRRVPLPSGFAQAIVPMKVYRGRKRGSNVPAVPVHRYTGDMRDTPALQRWVASLS
jgi:hypothetical protein